MNTQRILTNETEALCLMPTGDFFNMAEGSGMPETAGRWSAGAATAELSLMRGDHEGSSLPFLAIGDEDDDEDIEDDEDNFDDMDDDFDDDDDDFDDDFDDDDEDDNFDNDYDYDDDIDYDDDFEE
jgi:hypothetical protein